MKQLTPSENRQMERFVLGLKKMLGSNFVRAVLFGSRARNAGNEDSDVDVLVVIRKTSMEIKHKIWDLANDIFLETEIDISPLVMTEERMETLLKRERLLAKTITEEGIAL
ncbi:MAG: nucleotidyltransferase domain-containing protein [Deltaproteobacteria bacterium]|nr:nucleotidyltransferase domain-containing protein [Deltaproteobacteria bacterium]